MFAQTRNAFIQPLFSYGYRFVVRVAGEVIPTVGEQHAADIDKNTADARSTSGSPFHNAFANCHFSSSAILPRRLQ
jgi:hypothetical protein